uniref:Precursor of insect cytokine ENF peptide n=2 Tax=Samia pryeri TaxID=3116429 RepID=E1CEG2_9NEOP|nr:precursor of insect cytokine ENF peptide [Samia cynthia pryeri]
MKLFLILCCSLSLTINFCDFVNGSVGGLLSKLRDPLPTVDQAFRIVFRDSSEDTDRRDQTVTSATRSEVLETTTQTVTSTTSVSIVTTTKKDGRENFAGGCATGFMRTADGRCKPTFG